MSSKKWSRRDFLTAVGAAVPGVVLTACSSSKLRGRLPSTQNNSADSIYDCIVIGAGVSGLTLARELAHPKNGPGKNVLVLESSDRIGGRVSTDRSHFVRQVELGAEFVHMDPFSAPVWRELLRYNLKTWKLSKTDGYLYHPGKKVEDPRGARSVVRAAIAWNPFKALTVWNSFKVDPKAPDISAADLLNSKIIPKHDLFEEDFKRMILTGHLGALEEELSLRGFQADHIVRQLQYTGEFYIQKGYDSLTNNLADGIHIQLNEAVAKITYSRDRIIIESKSGKIFKARSAAIATSVGIIKNKKIEFSPPLPEEKLAAVESLQMSHHAKVQIEFTRQFWPKGMTMVHRPDQGRRMGKTYFVPQTDVPNAPPMLTALIMGLDAKKMLAMSDEEVLKNICLDLSPAFPNAGPVEDLVRKRPDGSPSYLVTHWNKDPNVMGGVSFIQYGHSDRIAPENVRQQYADPSLTPGLFWAGEAASTFTQAACVHGAHSAGARAAIEIFHFLDSNQSYLPASELEAIYKTSWVKYLAKAPPMGGKPSVTKSAQELEGALYKPLMEEHP